MKSDYNRRQFLKGVTVATATTLLFSGLPAFARGSSDHSVPDVKAISLDACKALSPEEISAGSAMVQQAQKHLEKMINSLKNSKLRQLVNTIYQQPEPLHVKRLDSYSRREIYLALSEKGYTEADESSFLPPLPGKRKDGEAFFSAPGSGYHSHHAYPGGLATHLATNVLFTNHIIDTYIDVYGYSVDRDTALGAQLLHDLHKPYVFQWQEDNSSRQEQTLAGTGEHHILSVAELIYRKMPAELVVATACAHAAPMKESESAQIATWLDAAAIIAGVDPITYGLVAKKNKGIVLANIARQEGYICHLGDHDYVLSVPAVQQTLPIIKRIAQENYRSIDNATFNAIRNLFYSSYSAMQVHHTLITKGEDAIKRLMFNVVQPTRT